jgi:hypothetical protein
VHALHESAPLRDDDPYWEAEEAEPEEDPGGMDGEETLG